VLRGLANARLVASLRVAGVNAVGLGAADGGLAEVELHPDAATIGQVGTVTAVRAELLQRLLDTGFTPVVSSIGARDGRLLNLNADELAGALAAATRASALFLLSDVEGLRLDGRLVLDLGRDAVPSLLARDDVRDGMIPKLEAAAAALAGGAERVLIGAWHGPGTLPELLSGRLRATHVWPTPTEVAHG
jgi:acetylglutamate kinase